MRKALYNILRRPTADSTGTSYVRDVVGNKSDSANSGVVGTTKSVIAYLKQLVTRGNGILAVTSNVVSSGIPNNTQTAGAITGAASGSLILEDVIFQSDGVGLAGPTNIELSTDNAKGKTGASAPIFLEAIASFGANLTVSKKDADSSFLPLVLETGKKIYIHGDDAAGSGSGEVDITLIFRPITEGATITEADIT